LAARQDTRSDECPRTLHVRESLRRGGFPEEVRAAIQAALNSPGAAVVEAVVDVEEKPAKPNELKA
jgi:hypothetical protein